VANAYANMEQYMETGHEQIHEEVEAHTDLVRCLLDAWTSISLLLNSFSSLRIAACRAINNNNELLMNTHTRSAVSA